MNQLPAVSMEVTDSVAIIRFNRPTERNPLSRATLLELKSLLAEIQMLDEVNAIVFTGAGDVFLSGANIRELTELQPDTALTFATLGQEILQTIAEAKPVTIAAVNGFCMGGGLDLALACDIRVASETAVFSHPGARLGIITGWCGTQRLPRLIGRSAALDLLLTGRRINADKALDLGLIAEVSADPLRTALSIARQNP